MLAGGATNMRRSFDGLALLVQELLRRDPHCGHLFVFRGKRGGLLKILWHDGPGDVPAGQATGTRPLHTRGEAGSRMRYRDIAIQRPVVNGEFSGDWRRKLH